MSVKISPSILSADFAKMGEDVSKLAGWGADWVHCDVMDGVFCPNITFGIPMVKAIRKYTDLPLDVHLMIVKPEKYVDKFLEAGADIITFHPEVSECVETIVDTVHRHGKLVGLVLNPNIEVKSIEKYLDMIDLVMLMGVYPGFSAQKFIEFTMDKISELKALIGDRDVMIEFDGGVSVNNIKEMESRGLNIAVSGSYVFGSQDPTKAIQSLKNA
ncbi:MAG: ribulose-phosphate 3-epimerase [Clostridia bacterium]|nr:ribulose-phosphate 3-epimerase [Clostridia bacterium]